MRLAILYNLREKSGPKIKYGQSYTNICSRKFPLLVTGPWVIPGNHRYSLGIGIPYVKYIAPEFQV